MLKTVFRILGRIGLILLVASLVAGLAYGLSTRLNGAGARFRPEGEPRFQPQAGSAGLAARPPRGPGDGEGFRENGSLGRGLFDVISNILVISIFTGIGLVIFGREKRPQPQPADKPSEE